MKVKTEKIKKKKNYMKTRTDDKKKNIRTYKK